MMSMEKEIIKFIDNLNITNLREWNERFEIHLVDIRNRLVHISMTDKKSMCIKDDYIYWSRVCKGANIWDAYNNFVNTQLQEDGDADNSK